VFGFLLDEICQILTLSRRGAAPCDRVLNLARQHLAAVEQRIAQLAEFRTRLAAAVARWDEQRETLTCGRLCQFIVDATIDAEGGGPPPLARTSPRQRAHAPGPPR